MNENRLLIIGVSRSGTTALQAALAAHPMVSMAPIELNIENVFQCGLGVFFPYGLDSPLQEKTTAAAFDAAASLGRKPEALWRGAKVAVGRPELAQCVAKAVAGWGSGVKVVHIVRENEVARLASMMVAKFTKNWHLPKGGVSTKRVERLWISRFCLSHSVVQSFLINKALCDLGKSVSYLRISYEQFSKNNDKETFRILEFLGLSPEEDSPSEDGVPSITTDERLVKMLPEPNDFVRNYRDLGDLEKQIKERLIAGSVPKFGIFHYKLLKFWSRAERYWNLRGLGLRKR